VARPFLAADNVFAKSNRWVGEMPFAPVISAASSD